MDRTERREGKGTVLVTGGTGGLGFAVTERLARAGYRVVVPYIVEQEAERARLSAADHPESAPLLIRADALSDAGVDAIFRAVDAQPAPLYALVHLLGGVRPFQSAVATPVEDWDAVFDLNLRSYFIFARRAMERFARARAGRIVSMGAMAALKPAANQSPYAAAKAGVIALTRVLADEGRAIGVTANCIAPSIIVTPANLSWAAEGDAESWVTPEEIAATIETLLAGESRSINGSVIRMFGKLNL